MSFLKRLVPLRAHLSVALQQLVVGEGDPFRGVAVLQADEPFLASQVRLEVRVVESWVQTRRERDPQGHEKSVRREMKETRFSQDVPVSGPFSVAAGETKQMPLEAWAPFVQPTLGAVSYSLKAVVAVKGRPDVTAEVHPRVVHASSGAPPFQPSSAAPLRPGSTAAMGQGSLFCTKCGSPLSPGGAFCPNCDQRV